MHTHHASAHQLAATHNPALSRDTSSPAPLLVTVRQACKMLACGKTTVFALINQGSLERRKIGKATRITLDSIKKLAGA